MSKIILYENKSQCCGCGACYEICPKGAIKMMPDEFGCLYPIIDDNLCIECGLCIKTCNYGKKIKESFKDTYVAVSTSTNIDMSASGGVFAALAKEMISQGGCVCGCAMVYEENKLIAKHICISSENDLYKLLGSKYVQSDTSDIYRVVEEKLQKNISVLFSGTPCQISGLYGYLKKEYKNLFTIDIVCHGVPSLKFFNDYISFIEKKEKNKIVEFKFRDKTEGWKLYASKVSCLNNGKYIKEYFEPYKSSYYQMFLNGYTYRDSCYSCPYAGENRQANITIGDFWCVELIHPELIIENGGDLNYQKGTSCLIINDQKGKSLIEQYGSGIKVWISNYEKAAIYNGQLLRPSKRPNERKMVLEEYKKGYSYVDKLYRKKQTPINIKNKIRKMVPKSMKKLIKKMLLSGRDNDRE